MTRRQSGETVEKARLVMNSGMGRDSQAVWWKVDDGDPR